MSVDLILIINSDRIGVSMDKISIPVDNITPCILIGTNHGAIVRMGKDARCRQPHSANGVGPTIASVLDGGAARESRRWLRCSTPPASAFEVSRLVMPKRTPDYLQRRPVSTLG